MSRLHKQPRAHWAHWLDRRLGKLTKVVKLKNYRRSLRVSIDIPTIRYRVTEQTLLHFIKKKIRPVFWWPSLILPPAFHYYYRNWSAALRDFTELLQQDPEDSKAYTYRARAHAKMVCTMRWYCVTVSITHFQNSNSKVLIQGRASRFLLTNKSYAKCF